MGSRQTKACTNILLNTADICLLALLPINGQVIPNTVCHINILAQSKVHHRLVGDRTR